MPVLWVFDLGLALSGFGLFVLDMRCTHRTLHTALQAQNTGFGVQRATEADLCGRTKVRAHDMELLCILLGTVALAENGFLRCDDKALKPST